MRKLTWDDLLIRDFTREDAHRWLSVWSWLVSGTLTPEFMTKFGDWYLRRPDGSIEMLDVLEGRLVKVADSVDDFYALVKTQEWQEENLLSLMVYQLHEQGMVPGAGQCYGFAPHPSISGDMQLEQVMIIEIMAWQTICSEFFLLEQATDDECT